jgi:hypothetical protein
MSLPPRYAIAKKGQVDKYSKIFGLFGNLALRVCQGPSTCTRTFKHGDPGYEVVTKFRSACENHTTPADDFEGDFAGADSSKEIKLCYIYTIKLGIFRL